MSTSLFSTLACRVFSHRALVSCLAVVVSSFVLFATTPAVAAVALDSVTVPIQTVVVPGQPIDLFFSEVPDVIHSKFLEFRGTATTVPGAVAPLDVQFDWFDPSVNNFVFSPVFHTDVILTVPFDFTWTIPFCPPEVSLHITNPGDPTGGGVPIQIDGTFHYECVPEPSTLALFGIALGSLVGYRLRRRFA